MPHGAFGVRALRQTEEHLPLEFCVLELVEKGVLVRFQETHAVKMPPGPFVPGAAISGEEWKASSGRDRVEIQVPHPVAVFCASSQDLLQAIERARIAFKAALEEDRGS